MASTTAATNQELSAARGGITQCRRALRGVKGILNVSREDDRPACVESLHDAIDALSVSVEALAKVVEGLLKQ